MATAKTAALGRPARTTLAATESAALRRTTLSTSAGAAESARTAWATRDQLLNLLNLVFGEFKLLLNAGVHEQAGTLQSHSWTHARTSLAHSALGRSETAALGSCALSECKRGHCC